MYDLLGNTIIMKVFSHQLTDNFQISSPGKSPKPIVFIVSANQFVGNAATQAHLFATITPTVDQNFFYSRLSSKWCFLFEGGLTNKVAKKVFQEKLDTDNILWQQHRSKQGLFI